MGQLVTALLQGVDDFYMGYVTSLPHSLGMHTRETLTFGSHTLGIQLAHEFWYEFVVAMIKEP